MVLQKRLDYGFNGYQVPPTPRATRSARKRSISKNKANENQMCAFDLLATVAGKLLLESDSSNSSADTSNIKEQPASLKDSVKKEDYNTDKPLDDKSSDQGICDRSFFVSELVSQAPILHDCSKEPLHAQVGACSGPASVVTTSEYSRKVDSPEQLVGDESKVGFGSLTKIENAELSDPKVPTIYILESENKTPVKTETLNNGKMSGRSMMADMCNSDCPVSGNTNTSALVSSDHSVKIPVSKDHISCGSFPFNGEDVKLGTRDDDENSGCTQPSTGNKAFRPQPCNGDRRIRKLMASDCWKESPTMKDNKKSNADVEDLRDACHNRKYGYKNQRSLRDYPFKKRKIYDYSLVSNTDGGINADESCGSLGKGSNGDASAFVGTLLGVTGPSSSSAVERASLQTTDSKVKLKIKSFRVPELFIEIPETATVGSLKRTVVEAVTAILGGGLHVGVLLQGKKIGDDSKTLLQTGISHNNKPDALGFTLEPSASQALVPLSPEGRPVLLHRDKPQPLTRYPAAPNHNAVQQWTSDMLPDPAGTNFSNFVESDHDSASSPPDMSQEKSAADSRALVAVPSMNAEALNVVPMRKPKRSESAQRRIRRPFSVSEVEALVQAVEKLGTGRWRDVKLRAFDNAKHRTYVDLKDKWKTLVHTARISPQQRRGEPVPQELLDRVLMAHAYWSQQQAKQQFKQHSEACLLL